MAANDSNLGNALRSLRLSRGLGLEETSRRGGVSKAALSAWENGTRHPRGPALARLLDALGTDSRTKARLLHLADPQQARITLADSHLGVPVDVGMVLRVMRERRGLAQSDLARQVGVSQATVSRWEAGEDVPSAETLHTLGFALGASVEETVALASAGTGGNPGLPNDPEATAALVGKHLASHRLHEITLLGWEAELWRRSTRSHRWDACLISVLSARACLLVGEERFEEIPGLARRALGLAETEPERLQAVPAIGSLAHADRCLGKSPAAAAEMAAEWVPRLPDSPAKAWMLRQRGMALVRLGRVAEGVDWVVRSSEMDLSLKPDHPEPWSHHAEMLAEAYLAAGEPRRASAIVGGRRERLFPSHLFVQTEHALGRSVSEAEMAYLRHYTRHNDGSLLARRRLARIERRQASLKGEPSYQKEPGILPDHTPETEPRLWAAVLRDHPG